MMRKSKKWHWKRFGTIISVRFNIVVENFMGQIALLKCLQGQKNNITNLSDRHDTELARLVPGAHCGPVRSEHFKYCKRCALNLVSSDIKIEILQWN